MKEIDFLINESSKYGNSIIQKKFYSRKNTVAYVIYDNKPRILKWFAPGFKSQLEKEFDVLNKGFSKINIPRVYEKDDLNNVIIMNYIPGKNLCDIINNENEILNKKEKIIIELASWFKKFHDIFRSEEHSYIRGDSILRNFIYTDKVWGLDFEEFRIGNIEEDIAFLCTSLLTTDPKYTNEKYHLSRLFIENYSKNLLINYKSFMKELTYSILYIMNQRGIDFSKKKAEEISENLFINIKN